MTWKISCQPEKSFQFGSTELRGFPGLFMAVKLRSSEMKFYELNVRSGNYFPRIKAIVLIKEILIRTIQCKVKGNNRSYLK